MKSRMPPQKSESPDLNLPDFACHDGHGKLKYSTQNIKTNKGINIKFVGVYYQCWFMSYR